MAITYVGGEHVTGTGTVPVPAGVSAGDLLLAYIGVQNVGPVDAAAGWTEIPPSDPIDPSDGRCDKLFFRIASGSEPASYDFTYGGGLTAAIGALQMVAYTGNINQDLPIYTHQDEYNTVIAMGRWQSSPGNYGVGLDGNLKVIFAWTTDPAPADDIYTPLGTPALGTPPIWTKRLDFDGMTVQEILRAVGTYPGQIAVKGGTYVYHGILIEVAVPEAEALLPFFTVSGALEIESPTGVSGVKTGTFDTTGSGEGVDWYLVPQLTDHGNEARASVIKSVRVTGKVTDANAGVHGFDVNEEIDVEAIEDGNANALTGPLYLPDTSKVTQLARIPVNCPNLVDSTVRVEGRWGGSGMRDRIDEILIEYALQGVRR